MECRLEGCNGSVVLNSKKTVLLRNGCHSFRTSYPCEKCGYLHFLSICGEKKSLAGVSNRQGKKAFFKNGKVIFKEEE